MNILSASVSNKWKMTKLAIIYCLSNEKVNNIFSNITIHKNQIKSCCRPGIPINQNIQPCGVTFSYFLGIWTPTFYPFIYFISPWPTTYTGCSLYYSDHTCNFAKHLLMLIVIADPYKVKPFHWWRGFIEYTLHFSLNLLVSTLYQALWAYDFYNNYTGMGSYTRDNYIYLFIYTRKI